MKKHWQLLGGIAEFEPWRTNSARIHQASASVPNMSIFLQSHLFILRQAAKDAILLKSQCKQSQ